MRTLMAGALLATLWTTPVLAQSSPPAEPQPEVQDETLGDANSYAALAKRAEAMDETLDFTALRKAWVSDPSYAPYSYTDKPFDLMRAAQKSFEESDVVTAMKKCDEALALFAFDPRLHFRCAFFYNAGGDDERSLRHRFIGRGLIDSILKSGDGKTPETAYEVITIAEEYAVLAELNLRRQRQALVRREDHSYDVLTPKNEAGEEVTLYFRIDDLMDWLSRQRSEEEAEPGSK